MAWNQSQKKTPFRCEEAEEFIERVGVRWLQQMQLALCSSVNSHSLGLDQTSTAHRDQSLRLIADGVGASASQ